MGIINYYPKKISKIPIKKIDNIMSGLEKYGRYQYTAKNNINSFLSHKFKKYRDKDIILIGKDDNRKKTIISINPTHKLIKTGKRKVKILKNW